MFKRKRQIILRYLANECSLKEIQMVEQWMNADPEFKKEIESMKQIWNIQKKQKLNINMNAAWEKITSQAEMQYSPKRTGSKAGFMDWLVSPSFARAGKGFAFVMLVVIVMFASFQLITRIDQNPTQNLVAYNTVKVDTGKRLTLTLSDGSKVTLDAGSEFKYPTEFADTREVYLKGEAFFQVARDPKHPFHVHANQAMVKVLGTKFNVRAWEDINAVEVAVESGLVAFSNSSVITDSVLLSKNKYSFLSADGIPSEPVTINIQEYTSWMNNEKYFHNASLKEVVAQLERWYGYQFYVDDESVLDKKLTIHLKRINMDDIIELIAVLTDTRVERNDNEFRILKK